MIFVSGAFVMLCSGVILMQTSQIIHGGERNYIMATVTLVYGFFMYLPQADMKRLLAYSTITQLAYMFLGLGLSVFGSQLAYPAAMAARQPLPTVLGTTRVLVNGRAAELLYADFGQVNLRVPDLPVSAGRLFLQVERDGQRSNTITVGYTTAAPAIFTANQSGSGYGAILHPNTGRLVQAEAPAAPGQFIEIYGTGLGAVANSQAVEKPVVLFYGPGIAGNIEVEPSYAGPAPGFAGLYQVNVRIPLGIPTGDRMRLELRTPRNLSSNSVELAIR